MKLCFTTTDCTRSMSMPWKVCCSKPYSTSMRLLRRRALKPPYPMQEPTAESTHSTSTSTMTPAETAPIR